MSTNQTNDVLVQATRQVDVELVERILQTSMQFYAPHFQTLQAQNAAAEAKQEILMQRIHDMQLTMAKVDMATINTRLAALESEKQNRDGMAAAIKTIPQLMGYIVIAVAMGIAWYLGKGDK